MGTYGLPNLGVESTYIKEISVHEFDDDIGSQGRIKVKLYMILVAVLLGTDNDQLIIRNVARMLREEIRKARIPPQVRELKQ